MRRGLGNAAALKGGDYWDGEWNQPLPAPITAQALSSADKRGFCGSTKPTLHGLARAIYSPCFPTFSSVKWDDNPHLARIS